MLSDSALLSRLLKLFTVITVVVVLYLAQDVFKPIALAVLASFLLAPAVRGIERLGARRVLAVAAVVFLALLALGGLGWLVADQVGDLAASVSLYRENIVGRVEALRPDEGGALGRARDLVDDIRGRLSDEQLAPPPLTEEAAAPAPREPFVPVPSPAAGELAADAPLPVRVVAPQRTPVEVLFENLGPLLTPLATAGLVIVLVIFFLLQREDLRNRLIRLVGEGQLLVTTRALDEAGRRVSRYLLTQLLINVAYGIPVAIGLTVIGVPNAPLWGLLAAILRYLPYLGPWLAALCPIILSLAVFDGWGRPLATIGLFVVLELISNNFVEPIVYGARIGVTPVSLLLAALFWTWLWGPLGLVLAAPLTVCLVVLGRHVQHLEFLSVVFGDEPVLPPGVRLYQRLLARDQLEAMELVDLYFQRDADATAASFFDDVLVPALSLADQDRRRSVLPAEQDEALRETFRELVEEVGDRRELTAGAAGALEGRNLLCLAAHSEADSLAAQMLARAAEADGAAVALHDSPPAGSELDPATIGSPDVVCVSALPPAALIHARQGVRQLSAACPDAIVLVGLWHAGAEEADAARATLIAAGADAVVTRIGEALEHARRGRSPTGSFVFREVAAGR